MNKELFKKIELQSIIVLTLILSAGIILLETSTTFNSPKGILGTICIAFALFYSIISFFTNNMKENYENVINHYQKTIDTINSSHKNIEGSYKELTDISTKAKVVGEYTAETEINRTLDK